MEYVATAEQHAPQRFDRLMQQAVAGQNSGHDGPVAVLANHDITAGKVIPEAAPAAARLDLLTENDWQHVAASSTPFTELWSKANRRSVEAHMHNRYASYDPATGRQVTYESTPAEQWDSIQSEARLYAQPALHGTTVETLTKARSHGSFLSNREVNEQNGGYQDLLTDVGNTWDEDREVGLDGYVFADFGRPATRRLDEQADVVVVFKPQSIQKDGTIITDRDYVDALRNHKTTNPRAYMRTVYTPEDFYATASMQAATKTSASGHTENGVFMRNHLSIDETLTGHDGDYDERGMAHFSTWEVKIPEVSFDEVDRLIFRTEEARDAYLVANPDDATPHVVEPSIRGAMARREDIFGTNARQETAQAEKIAADYAVRKAIIDAADPSMRSVEYQFMHGSETYLFNPAWTGQESFSSPDDIVRRNKQTRRTGAALMSLFADEGEPAEHLSDEQVHIARIIRVGDTAVIEEITAY